ncbi:thymidine kinase [Gottschalkia purinilytica]|uniref:Thymidine kinase n=1 Tax=Gottschalkia purinilytica TaxID=1503 RepID=A0A0L0WCU1_GOTPU|nr:thymidine kinase [Gottschalkia purinilytica]KNF09276.1 thymidine kinase [Gottschalkia purinilytica]
MAQLFFIYSTMNSGKSLDLLKSAHNYTIQGKVPLLFTSEFDTRNIEITDNDLKGEIFTRVGLKQEAWLIERVNVISLVKSSNADCIFVDEAQFLKEKHVITLTEIVDKLNVPVICYGLKNDFLNNLFEGSKMLLTYADKIQEMKTICFYCNRKATMNMRLINNVPHFSGQQICIDENKQDKEVSYLPVCRKCYMNFKQGK